MNFYAAKRDGEALLGYLVAQDDFEVWEAHTQGKPPTRLGPSRLTTLCETFRILVRASGSTVLSESAEGTFEVQGWGLIQVHLRPPRGQQIPRSTVTTNTAARALNWEARYRDRLGLIASWDWNAVATGARRVERQIRTMGEPHEPGRPLVLPEAAKLVADGWLLSN